MLTEQEQQQDYMERVARAAPKVDAILREEFLNLGAQFDPRAWPREIKAVPIYTDVKDYSKVEESKTTIATAPDKPQLVESPIQREDLEAPEEEGDTNNDK